MALSLSIDFNKISIESTDLKNNDRRWSFCVPADLVDNFLLTLRSKEAMVTLNKAQVILQELCLEHLLGTLKHPPHFPAVVDNQGSPPLLYEGKDFEFSFLVDSILELPIPEFSQIQLKRPVGKITNKMIQEEVERQQLMLGERSPSKNAAAIDDEVTCDIDISDSSGAVESCKNVVFQISSGGTFLSVPGYLSANITKDIVGKSIGDNVHLSFSRQSVSKETENHETMKAVLTVTGISHIALATVEDICQSYGFVNEKILFQNIKFSMLQKQETSQFNFLLHQVEKQLPRLFKLSLPPRVIPRSKENLSYVSMHVNPLEVVPPEFSSEENHAFLVLTMWSVLFKSEFGKQNGVTEDDLSSEISIEAADLGIRLQELRENLVRQRKMDQINFQAHRRKCAEAIFSEASVEEIMTIKNQDLVTDGE